MRGAHHGKLAIFFSKIVTQGHLLAQHRLVGGLRVYRRLLVSSFTLIKGNLVYFRDFIDTVAGETALCDSHALTLQALAAVKVDFWARGRHQNCSKARVERG